MEKDHYLNTESKLLLSPSNSNLIVLGLANYSDIISNFLAFDIRFFTDYGYNSLTPVTPSTISKFKRRN